MNPTYTSIRIHGLPTVNSPYVPNRMSTYFSILFLARLRGREPRNAGLRFATRPDAVRGLSALREMSRLPARRRKTFLLCLPALQKASVRSTVAPLRLRMDHVPSNAVEI